MNYFYDTEFLEGTQKTLFGKTVPTIDLISIGIVTQRGAELYMISRDFNLKEAWNRHDLKEIGDARNMYGDKETQKVYWIRENVLRPIFNTLATKYNAAYDIPMFPDEHISEFNYRNMKVLINAYGNTREEIAREVRSFIYKTSGINDPYAVGNWEDIKHNFPINLYGYFSAYDHVAFCWLFGKMIDLPRGFPMYTRDLKQMFDETISPDEIRSIGYDKAVERLKNHELYPKDRIVLHHALEDAKWNKDLYHFLKTIK